VVARYVQQVDAAAASALAGVPLERPAWFYRGGGWIDPAALARSYLARAGNRAALRTGVRVARLERDGPTWRLVDDAGRVIGRAETVVLANADDAGRLLGGPDWPVEAVRGQLSWAMLEAWPPGAVPRVPIVGAGYVLPSVAGRVLFGATSIRGDDDASGRDADHAENLRRIAALSSAFPAGMAELLESAEPEAGHVVAAALRGGSGTAEQGAPAWAATEPPGLKAGAAGLLAPGLDGLLLRDRHALGGRTEWRSVAADRLPVIGAVPALDLIASSGPCAASPTATTVGTCIPQPGRAADGAFRSKVEDGRHAPPRRLDQPRFVPREAGLFVFSALGSRGITWSALGAEVLAATISGAPLPLESALVDAVDPARFVSRNARRA
jgi:tRNA 5-methylaminomethyl-2-thiouridine biosynthesis bifunctional protein